MPAQQMHAAVLHATGGTPRYETFPAPVAGEGQAVVTVTAAALKPYDRFMAAGAHWAGPRDFPQAVGADGVGGWRTAAGWRSSGRSARTAGWPNAPWSATRCGSPSPSTWTA